MSRPKSLGSRCVFPFCIQTSRSPFGSALSETQTDPAACGAAPSCCHLSCSLAEASSLTPVCTLVPLSLLSQQSGDPMLQVLWSSPSDPKWTPTVSCTALHSLFRARPASLPVQAHPCCLPPVPEIQEHAPGAGPLNVLPPLPRTFFPPTSIARGLTSSFLPLPSSPGCPLTCHLALGVHLRGRSFPPACVSCLSLQHVVTCWFVFQPH